MSSSPASDVTPHGDPDKFRHVLSHVPTSVVVITAVKDDGTKAGLVIGSFTSISLDPQLVGFYPTHKSTSWPPIREVGKFCINVLAQGQNDLAAQFSKSGGDKFQGVNFTAAPHSGAPILDDVVAWIDCELDQEIELGDHFLAVAKVIDLDVHRAAHPMVFSRGAYPLFLDED
ncbi:flavin reductase family protein [Patulibacter minatonensis]|uniref:flavin reductase family protein n=1 Tax=Patulibacter minatonensis TaxID=298163 RepID=UPI0005614961|nr:flavin reductase family protein [Patulibacter minatonensis]